MFKYGILIVLSFSSLVAMEPTPEQALIKAKKEKFDREIDEFNSKSRSTDEIATFANKKADELATLNQQQRKANSDAQDKGLASVDRLIKEQNRKNEQSNAIGRKLQDATTPDEFVAMIDQMVATSLGH